MPTEPGGYSFNISEAAQGVLGDLAGDPAVEALRAAALAKGWSQGQFDDRIGTAIDVLAEAGLLEPGLNPTAELAKLGENGAARRQEVETFATQLKDRGEIDDGEYAELVSLAPTASGVTLMEKLRKMMTPSGASATPAGGDNTPAGGEPGDTPEQAEARTMRRDPKYDSDREFRRAADQKFAAAFSGSR